MTCIIAEFLLFSITLAPWRIICARAGFSQPNQGAELAAVIRLLFEIFRANIKIFDTGKKTDVIGK